jgi:hypothetical protein
MPVEIVMPTAARDCGEPNGSGPQRSSPRVAVAFPPREQNMKTIAKILGLALLTACLAGALAAPSYAGMIGTTEVLAEQTSQADRDKLQQFLNRTDVQERLQAMDVPAIEARSRVDALTPAEAASLAQRLDALPAGGALSGSDVTIILLVALLVVLIL